MLKSELEPKPRPPPFKPLSADNERSPKGKRVGELGKLFGALSTSGHADSTPRSPVRLFASSSGAVHAPHSAAPTAHSVSAVSVASTDSCSATHLASGSPAEVALTK